MGLIILPYQAGLAVGITGANVTEMGQGDNVNISVVTCELQPALGTSGAGCSGQREQQGQRYCCGKESA